MREEINGNSNFMLVVTSRTCQVYFHEVVRFKHEFVIKILMASLLHKAR